MVGLGIFGAMVLVTSVAAAPAGDLERVALGWESSGPCPGPELVRERLHGYLAGSAGTTSGDHVTANVVVASTESGLKATLELTTAWGASHRDLEASRCEDIADAVALVIATTLDPLLDLRAAHRPHDLTTTPAEPTAADDDGSDPGTAAQPRVPASAPALPASSISPPAPASTRASRRRPPKRTVAMIGGFAAGVGGGLRPRAGAIVEVTLGMKWRWLRVLAIGSHGFARERTLSQVPEGAITLRMWSAGAMGCGVPAFSRLEIPACVGVEGGAIIGEGVGLATTDEASRPWIGVAARTGLHLRVAPRLALALDLHGIGVALRPRFHVVGVGPVFTAAPVAGRALLGLQVQLP